MNRPIDLRELAGFLDEANKHGYAAGGKKVSPTRISSKDLEYKKGNLIYHDTYFGVRDYIGEEVVYKDEKPIWGANYLGFILDDGFAADQVYDFLKKSLTQEYDDIIPVRGPKFFEEGDYQYINTAEGKLDKFTGKEEILFKDKVVYRAFYHGGFIK
ncbi:MAG: XRE family transcriptional regulator [Candidatus Harrisonbacteria bacterium]|nr:XRE family transcriptional regulator [Candidatus Harrisonbacteria bacterium]